MKKYFNVGFDKKITLYKFNKNILPMLHEYFINNRDKELIFDFSNVEFIDSEVIPLFLSTGFIIKNYYGYPPPIYIPWRLELLSFLYDIGFFNIVRKYNLFELDERLIGGFETGKISKRRFTYCFEYGTSTFEIREVIRNSHSIIEGFANSDSKEEVISAICEICKNGCNHSGELCFITIDANKKINKAIISISDPGVGFYYTFFHKIKEGFDDFKTCQKEDFIAQVGNNRIKYSIGEAIFYRKYWRKYGIYQVVENIFKRNGTFKIQSSNVQFVLTKKNFGNYMDDERSIVDLYKSSSNYKSNYSQFNPIRTIQGSLKGSHIVFTIPINRGELYDKCL